VLLMAVAGVAACRAPVAPGGPGGPGHGGGRGLGTGSGYVDRRDWRAAQDEYLAFATEELTPTSPTNVLAHLTRAARDHRFAFGSPSVTITESGATLVLDTERWTRHAEVRPR